jgi:hypothetical protein
MVEPTFPVHRDSMSDFSIIGESALASLSSDGFCKLESETQTCAIVSAKLMIRRSNFVRVSVLSGHPCGWTRLKGVPSSLSIS